MKLTKAIIFFLSFMGSAAMAEQVQLATDSTIIAEIDILRDSSWHYLYINTDKAYNFANKANSMAKSIAYTRGIADNTALLGHINSIMGQDYMALSQYLIAEGHYCEIQDSTKIAYIMTNIANIYLSQKQFLKAIEKLKKARKLLINSKSDSAGIASIDNNTAVALLELDFPDSALQILNKLYDAASKTSDSFSISVYAQNIGEAYLAKKEYAEASTYLDTAYSIASSSNDIEGMILGLVFKGKLELAIGDENGINHVLQGIQLAEDHNQPGPLPDAYQIVAQYYLSLNDYKNANEHLIKYAAIRDSIFTPEIARALSELQAKELENLKNKEIADLQALNEKKLENTRFKNYLLLAIMAVVLVSFVLGMILFFQRQNSTRRLSMQKQEIENQKEAIEKVNKLLQENNAELNSISEEKSNLIRMVAHDLKSPLNRINGLSSVVMLEEARLSADQADAMNKMKTTSSQLSSLIDKILDVEAIESQQPNANFQNVMIQPLMDEYMKGFKVVASEKNISLAEDYSGNNMMVNIDVNYASQIFENLISNAFKFSQRDSAVQVTVKDFGNNVRIAIQDDGPGLTDEDKSKLFKKFQKLSAQPTGNEDSTGLGLSIVKKYVTAMNGKVWAESIFGEGSIFIVQLPGILVEEKTPTPEQQTA